MSRASTNASEGIARDDVWRRIAHDAHAVTLDASYSTRRVLGRGPAELVGASLVDVVDDTQLWPWTTWYVVRTLNGSPCTYNFSHFQ